MTVDVKGRREQQREVNHSQYLLWGPGSQLSNILAIIILKLSTAIKEMHNSEKLRFVKECGVVFDFCVLFTVG